jgi:hypothetical protein
MEPAVVFPMRSGGLSMLLAMQAEQERSKRGNRPQQHPIVNTKRVAMLLEGSRCEQLKIGTKNLLSRDGLWKD